MRLKRAFSLIEVLLVMGIIAVVTAMGFSISKTGMEKAYNLYWYTGYEALWNVTTDANVKGKFDPTTAAPADLTRYAQHIANMINNAQYRDNCSGTNSVGIGSNQCRTVTVPNGIQYEIWSTSLSGFYFIDMTIPALRQRRAFANKTRFVYMYREAAFPIDGMIYPSTFQGSGNMPYLNLQDRVDLLTFYLADSNPNSNSNRTFYSFRDAFCHAYYHNPDTGNNSYPGYQFGSNNSYSIMCPTNFQATPALHSLPIIPINPRKAF